MAEGVAIITVTTEDGGFTAACVVEVRSGNLVKGYSFESQAEADEWTLLDADGNELNRFWTNDFGMRAYDGSGLMTSESFSNELDQVLYPDNWLISPEFTVNDAFDASFYYAGQSIDYYDGYFAVYVATDGGENWEQIADLYSAYAYQPAIIDLSQYEGQTIQVAFRHYDVCYIFRINIDLVQFWGDAVMVTDEPLMGDVDDNGVVDSTDALLILRYSKGRATLTDEQLAAADTDGNGVANAQDSVTILRMMTVG